MQLKFGTKRVITPLNWDRAMVIRDDSGREHLYILSMTGEGHRMRPTKRTGFVHMYDANASDGRGALKWQGNVPVEGEPLRATCVAAGIVDTNGTPLRPGWLR
jgi:hypothetical protein